MFLATKLPLFGEIRDFDAFSPVAIVFWVFIVLLMIITVASFVVGALDDQKKDTSGKRHGFPAGSLVLGLFTAALVGFAAFALLMPFLAGAQAT